MLQIDLPNKFHFTTEIRIYISYINYGGHLGNDSLLSLIHEARIRYLKSLGYSEADIEGFGLIMTNSVIIYKSQGFHGEVIKVDICVRDFTKVGCDFVYRLVNKETGKEIARATTGVAIFDYKTEKLSPVPKKFIERCNNTPKRTKAHNHLE